MDELDDLLESVRTSPIPRPLQQLLEQSYKTYLRSKKWKDIRAVVLQRDNHQCQACNAPAQEVHHWSYDADTLDGTRNHNLVSLCRQCHDFIEDGVASHDWSEKRKRFAYLKTTGGLPPHLGPTPTSVATMSDAQWIREKGRAWTKVIGTHPNQPDLFWVSADQVFSATLGLANHEVRCRYRASADRLRKTGISFYDRETGEEVGRVKIRPDCLELRYRTSFSAHFDRAIHLFSSAT